MSKNNREPAPVLKGKNYLLTIDRLGSSGEGIARYQGFTVFVPYALMGEEVEARITEVKKNYAKATLSKIVKASDKRVQPPCSVYESCGGCQLQHLDYQAQLDVKQQTVIDAITRIGKLENVTVHQTLGAAEPWYYRNKMQFPIGKGIKEIMIGCYAQGTHNIVSTEDCCIQHAANNQVSQAVKEAAEKLEISIYSEATGQGVLRHIVSRVGAHSNEVMAVLVTASEKMPHQEALIAALREKVPGLVSIAQNINLKPGNVILGHKTKLLWGKKTIVDSMGDFSFHISPRSFFQVNTKQAEVLYQQAVRYALLTGTETVIDAYCGTGTISLFLAKAAKKVYGIEVVPETINDARKNAQDNQVENVEFIVGDAVEVMPNMLQKGIRPDVIVVDPPRAGCEQTVLDAFIEMQPKRIVYVSCNPASLARDLAYLSNHDYITREIQPVDMFPQTFHIETVTLLQRKETTI